MKNFLFVLTMSVFVGLFTTSCTGCGGNKNTTPEAPDVELATIDAERSIALDRQDMFINTRQNSDLYRWFETQVTLQNFLDEENDGVIEKLTNVFQSIDGDGQSYDTYVIKYHHFIDKETEKEVIHDFWIESRPLNDEAIKITFKEAYDKVMATNLPKPHSRMVILRKVIGITDANPQWIFGNIDSQIYVDAFTGEISDEDPAWKSDTIQLKKPLGEWP